MTAPEPNPHGLGLDRFAFDAALALLDCLTEQLASTVGGPVARAALYPGADIAAMDECCDGQAAVRVYRIFPMTGRFPQQNYGIKECGTGASYGLILEMTVYRCAATLDDRGRAPSAEALTEDVRVQMDDAAAMRRAITCCFGPTLEARRYSGVSLVMEDDYNPINGGDCNGGRQRLTVQVYEAPCDTPAMPL